MIYETKLFDRVEIKIRYHHLCGTQRRPDQMRSVQFSSNVHRLALDTHASCSLEDLR